MDEEEKVPEEIPEEIPEEKEEMNLKQLEEDLSEKEGEREPQSMDEVAMADLAEEELKSDNIYAEWNPSKTADINAQMQRSGEKQGEREETNTVRWNELKQICPTEQVFPNHDGGEYLRIELKELWYLPKKEWSLGNNSFLLHGYYSYRYLILGRLDENHYVLGIPGRFHHQEKSVADMFGFNQFQPIIGKNVRVGQFGYWCKDIWCDNREYRS